MRSIIFALCFLGIGFCQAPDTSLVIPTVLARSVDSKKVKVGDEVLARTTAALMAQDKILVPQGAKVIGRVTQATARSRGDGTSSLVFAFDRIQLKGGRTLTLIAPVQAIAAPEPPPPMELPSGAGNGPVRDASASSTSTGVCGSTTAGIPEIGTQPAGALPSAAGSGAVFTPRSTGVIGIHDLQLTSEGDRAVISSSRNSVKLESGTRILLRASRISPEAAAPPTSGPR